MHDPVIPLSSIAQDVVSPLHQNTTATIMNSPTYTLTVTSFFPLNLQSPQNRFKIPERVSIASTNIKHNRPMTAENLSRMINSLVSPKTGSTFRSNSTYTAMLRNEQNKGLKSSKNFKAFLENMEATRIASENRLEDTVKLIEQHETDFKTLKKQVRYPCCSKLKAKKGDEGGRAYLQSA